MNVNDSVLLKVFSYYLVISMLVFYVAFNLFRGFNILNEKKVETDNLFLKIVATKLIPIVLICSSIWLTYRPIVDYFIKDYQTNSGIVERVNASYKNVFTQEVVFEGEQGTYYSPRGLLDSNNVGEEYKFCYSKRSHVILNLSKISN